MLLPILHDDLGQPGVDVHLDFLDISKGGILFQEGFDGIAHPGLQLGLAGAVVHMVFGRQAACIHPLEFDIAGKVHTLRCNPEVNLQPVLPTRKGVQDIVGAANSHELADVMSQVLIKETREILSERSEVLQNPEFSDFLGEGEGVVLGGNGVFLHGIFLF